MTMSTTDATAAVARSRPDGSIVITTMSTLRTFPVQSPSPLNLGCVPLMGGASALGLGVALAQPERHVIVLDGDGSLLMQLGSLATIAEVAPAKFFHFVFDNGVWFEGGASIPVPASTALDWSGMARSAGYRTAHSFADRTRLDAELARILAATGPCFIHLAIDPGRSDRSPWSSTNPQEETSDLQFTRMGDEARVVRSTLKQLSPHHHVAGDADHREEERQLPGHAKGITTPDHSDQSDGNVDYMEAAALKFDQKRGIDSSVSRLSTRAGDKFIGLVNEITRPRCLVAWTLNL